MKTGNLDKREEAMADQNYARRKKRDENMILNKQRRARIGGVYRKVIKNVYGAPTEGKKR